MLVLVCLVYIAVGIYALTDPSFKTHLARLGFLWLAVPTVITVAVVSLAARTRRRVG